MDNAFQACTNINIKATDIPDLSLVFNMNYMFTGCNSLNGPANISDWNTETITFMTGVFQDAVVFKPGYRRLEHIKYYNHALHV
jgi:trimeric autotransporter adhesin